MTQKRDLTNDYNRLNYTTNKIGRRVSMNIKLQWNLFYIDPIKHDD